MPETLPIQPGDWSALNDYLTAGARYQLISDGTTVRAIVAGGTRVVASGTDAGAVLTAILPTANSAGARIEFRNDGNVFPWRSTPALPRGITGKLLIHGNGSLIQAAVSAGRRFLDFDRTADYQTFQNIEIDGFTFDRASLTAGFHEHVLIGNIVNGAWTSRVNFQNITIRNCKTLNVPVGTTVSYQNVSLGGYHVASGETQTTITDIRIENCDFLQGGNIGGALLGSGSAYTAGLGVNVYLDRIFIDRVLHDTGRVPTVFNADANFQIGGVGFAGTVRMNDCYGARSADVAYEIDGVQDFLAKGCIAVDSWNAKFFSRNFRAPVALNAQKNTWRDCYARNVALDRILRDASDYEIGGDAATAGYIFGEMSIDGGHSSDEITTAPNISVLNLAANGIQFRRLTVRDWSVSYTALNYTAGGNSPVPVDIRSLYAGAVYDIDGLHWRLSGNRSGAGNNQFKMVRIAGTDVTLFLRRMTIDMAGWAGLTTAGETFYWVALATDATSTIRTYIDGISFVTSPTGGGHYAIFMGNPFYTVGGTRAYIEHLDTAKLPGGAGFDISFGNAANKAATLVRNTISQRTAASGSGAITAPTALTGLVTATGVTVGSVSAGVPCIVQFVQGTGAGITAIDFSTNVGTNYVNLLTQAAGAMPAGADLVLGPLPPDALIKVTFTTTQPTINLVPVNS